MNQQGTGVVRRLVVRQVLATKQQILAAPIQPGKGTACECCGERLGYGPAQSAVMYLDCGNGASDGVGRDAATSGFYLGQFGHGGDKGR